MKGDGAGGSRVRLRAAWRRIPRRRRPRRPGGPAARRSACVLHAVAMFVQQQVAVVVACVWRVPAVVCVREELLLLERAIAAPVLSRPSARTLRSRFNSQRALHRSAVLLLHTAVLFPPTAAPRLHFFSNLFAAGRGGVVTVTCQPSLPFSLPCLLPLHARRPRLLHARRPRLLLHQDRLLHQVRTMLIRCKSTSHLHCS